MRRRPSKGWESLTESETQVVQLVAARLSNPEIAERLVVSRRTVEAHVSHALSKLGCASRQDLAQLVAARGGARSLNVDEERDRNMDVE